MTRRRFAEHHTRAYRRARAPLIGHPCWRCGNPATTADHIPPLAEWYQTHQTPWQGELRPSCTPCQHIDGGWRLVTRLRQTPPRSALWK